MFLSRAESQYSVMVGVGGGGGWLSKVLSKGVGGTFGYHQEKNFRGLLGWRAKIGGEILILL